MGLRQGLDYIINLKDGSFSRTMSNAQRQTSAMDSAVKSLNNTIRAGATAFFGQQLFAIGEEAVLTSAKINGMDRAIQFTGGQRGAANLAFLRAEADRLGLDLMAAERGYVTLSGAMMGNERLARSQNEIYTAVGEAMTALNRDGEAYEGSLLAISQMASKGTVSAEELRGQLGERLPGAFGIAARAMNMTEAALGKAMQKGEVFADQFLPAFAAELHKTFGQAATENANEFTANMNRQNNALLEQKRVLGEELQPAYLTWIGLQTQGYALLAATAKFYKDNEEGITALAVGLGVAAGAYGVFLGIQKGALAIQAIQYTAGLLHLAYLEGLSLGLGKAAAAQHALNVAMNLNPIGLIITGIGLLAAGIYYAWQKSETFRGTIKGIWAATTELLTPVMALGKAMIGIATFNPAMVASGISEAITAVRNMDVKGAFETAFKAEVNGSKEEKKPAFAAAAATGKTGAVKGAGAGGSASAGRSVRNVNVTIHNLVKDLTIKATTIKESASDVRRELSKIMVDATRDYEQAIG